MVWLNSEQMAELFNRYKSVISKFSTTTKHGVIEGKSQSLLIAESNPKEKAVLIDLIMNFLMIK